MFTGLVQDVGEVVAVRRGEMLELTIHTALAKDRLVLGESIAIDGVCLTVVTADAAGFTAQLSEETERRTTLGALTAGDAGTPGAEGTAGSRVNLERAMQLTDRLGGHLVLGHVDGVARILTREERPGGLALEVELPEPLSHLFIEKGSVTVDGVSLTVNALSESSFSLFLIPETLARTTLAAKQAGDRVNLEADVIGKYVARLTRRGATSVSDV